MKIHKSELLSNAKGEDCVEIKVLICDDEPAFVDQMAQAIQNQPLPKEVSINITRTSQSETLTDEQLSQYQIMFLDVMMEPCGGMELARRVRKLGNHAVLIFVTNYVQFSPEGYEVRAFRYVLKQELEKRLPSYFCDALTEILREEKVLEYSVNGEGYQIPHAKILYLESRQRMIYLHAVNSEQAEYHFYGILEKLTEELEPDGFLRIQKSYLVNMAHIKKLNFDRVLMSNGKVLPVSQKRYSELKKRYLSWKGSQWARLH